MEEQILELLKSGETYTAIKNKFHISGETIGKITTKYNIDRGRKKQNDLIRAGYKKCTACFEIKLLDQFPTYSSSRGVIRESYCIECSKTNLKVTLSKLIAQAKNRAKNKKIEFDISVEYILDLLEKQNRKCFYSGKQLGLVFNNNFQDVMSIDRIDSSKGYTRDNVVLCCAIVNYIKNSMTTEEMVDWCTAISENMKEKYLH
jgi:hypothetical protein